MEVLGGLGAIVALADLARRMYKKLRSCVKSLTHAVESFKAIQREVKVFSRLLHRFAQNIKDTQGESDLTNRVEESLTGEIVTLGRYALEGVQKLIEDVANLRSDKDVSFFTQLVARFKWAAKQEKNIVPIRISLQNVATYANWFMTTLMLETLMAAGRAIGEPSSPLSIRIGRQIEDCRHEIMNLQSERRELQKECLALRKTFSDLARLNLDLLRRARVVDRDHMQAHPELRDVLNGVRIERMDSSTTQPSPTGSSPRSIPSSSPSRNPRSRPITPPSSHDGTALTSTTSNTSGLLSPIRPVGGVATALYRGPQRTTNQNGRDDEHFEIVSEEAADTSEAPEQDVIVVRLDGSVVEEFRRPRLERRRRPSPRPD